MKRPRMFRCTSMCVLATICLLPARAPLSAHDGHEGADSPSSTSISAPLPPAMILPSLEGARPWSEAPLLNDPDRFHFAVMTDNTGGHRPGIWMQGVRTVNLLRPSFVVSVGDLIEGYTEDPVEIEKQWAEFLGFIDAMQMRFFFVAGNHDVSNPVMHEHWRKHFGREWYSFDYQGVHFVCLSSEDPVDRIGPEQLRWVAEDLATHEEARWTFVFLHKPLWVYAERDLAAGNPDGTNWKQVERYLGSRPHTVFAGHVHHYVQYQRNGMHYYHLATTGGGSQLRGIPYGEFDHVTWVTMERDGPHVAHLLLNGVLAPESVTEQGIARFRAFLAATQLEVAPILVRSEAGFDEGVVHIRLRNQFSRPVRAEGRIEGLPLRGLTLDPESLRISAAGEGIGELQVRVRFAVPVELDRLRHSVLTARLRTEGDDPPLTAEKTVPVIIDREHVCPLRRELVAWDGALDEWEALPYSTGEGPLVTGAAETWQGRDDAFLAFQVVASPSGDVCIATNVIDDTLRDGDAVEFILDPRPVAAAVLLADAGPGAYRFRISAPTNDGKANLSVLRGRSSTVRSTAEGYAARTERGYSVELKIPQELLDEAQGGRWTRFRIAAVLFDQDEATGGRRGEGVARIHWRGTGRIPSSTENLAFFARE